MYLQGVSTRRVTKVMEELCANSLRHKTIVGRGIEEIFSRSMPGIQIEISLAA